MDHASNADQRSATPDWRGPASVEYREKRADLEKKVAASIKAEQRAAERRTELERRLCDLDAGARAFGLVLEQPETTIVPAAMSASGAAHVAGVSAEGSAKEIILDALTAVYPEGLKAKRLRAIIEKRLGREVHYKTPGMTLYRLAEAGTVKRDGYFWFLAAPPLPLGPDSDHASAPDNDFDELLELDPDAYEPDWDQIQQEEERMTGG